MAEFTIPRRVSIRELLDSRYPNHARPAQWDRRVRGIDQVEVEGLGEVRLLSEGDQSPPQPGWSIILTAGNAKQGFAWTLYGLGK